MHNNELRLNKKKFLLVVYKVHVYKNKKQLNCNILLILLYIF